MDKTLHMELILNGNIKILLYREPAQLYSGLRDIILYYSCSISDHHVNS